MIEVLQTFFFPFSPKTRHLTAWNLELITKSTSDPNYPQKKEKKKFFQQSRKENQHKNIFNKTMAKSYTIIIINTEVENSNIG